MDPTQPPAYHQGHRAHGRGHARETSYHGIDGEQWLAGWDAAATDLDRKIADLLAQADACAGPEIPPSRLASPGALVQGLASVLRIVMQEQEDSEAAWERQAGEIARLTAALAEQTAERVRFREMVDADRYALAEALGLAEWHWPEPIAIARHLQKERRELLLMAYYEKVALVEKLLAAAALRGETTKKGSE